MNENIHSTLEGRRPCWNIVALLAPFAGLLCGIVVGAARQGVVGRGPWAEGIMWGVLVLAGFGAAGLLAASIAWVRVERLWGITLLGFILNTPLALGFALFGGWIPF